LRSCDRERRFELGEGFRTHHLVNLIVASRSIGPDFDLRVRDGFLDVLSFLFSAKLTAFSILPGATLPVRVNKVAIFTSSGDVALLVETVLATRPYICTQY